MKRTQKLIWRNLEPLGSSAERPTKGQLQGLIDQVNTTNNTRLSLAHVVPMNLSGQETVDHSVDDHLSLIQEIFAGTNTVNEITELLPVNSEYKIDLGENTGSRLRLRDQNGQVIGHYHPSRVRRITKRDATASQMVLAADTDQIHEHWLAVTITDTRGQESTGFMAADFLVAQPSTQEPLNYQTAFENIKIQFEAQHQVVRNISQQKAAFQTSASRIAATLETINRTNPNLETQALTTALEEFQSGINDLNTNQTNPLSGLETPQNPAEMTAFLSRLLTIKTESENNPSDLAIIGSLEQSTIRELRTVESDAQAIEDTQSQIAAFNTRREITNQQINSLPTDFDLPHFISGPADVINLASLETANAFLSTPDQSVNAQMIRNNLANETAALVVPSNPENITQQEAAFDEEIKAINSHIKTVQALYSLTQPGSQAITQSNQIKNLTGFNFSAIPHLLQGLSFLFGNKNGNIGFDVTGETYSNRNVFIQRQVRKTYGLNDEMPLHENPDTQQVIGQMLTAIKQHSGQLLMPKGVNVQEESVIINPNGEISFIYTSENQTTPQHITFAIRNVSTTDNEARIQEGIRREFTDLTTDGGEDHRPTIEEQINSNQNERGAISQRLASMGQLTHEGLFPDYLNPLTEDLSEDESENALNMIHQRQQFVRFLYELHEQLGYQTDVSTQNHTFEVKRSGSGHVSLYLRSEDQPETDILLYHGSIFEINLSNGQTINTGFESFSDILAGFNNAPNFLTNPQVYDSILSNSLS